MNERLKELAKKANANELSYAYYRGEKKPENAVTLHSVDLELFAELIVRECGVALNPSVQNRNVISRGQAYDLIKKHFGVEE